MSYCIDKNEVIRSFDIAFPIDYNFAILRARNHGEIENLEIQPRVLILMRENIISFETWYRSFRNFLIFFCYYSFSISLRHSDSSALRYKLESLVRKLKVLCFFIYLDNWSRQRQSSMTKFEFRESLKKYQTIE